MLHRSHNATAAPQKTRGPFFVTDQWPALSVGANHASPSAHCAFAAASGKLILVEYQALARAPESTLKLIYAQLGEPPFKHDFDNVEYTADNFDMALGTRGLHTVRGKVEWVERDTVLPPELFRRFVNDMFWRIPEANIRRVPIVRFEGHREWVPEDNMAR
jgi:hypothetical protein